MSEQNKHTPGLLKVFNLTDIFTLDRRGDEKDGFQVADCNVDYDSESDPGLSFEERKANARRLVACWNALKGVPTDALENGFHPSIAIYFETAAKRDALHSQITQLRGALKELHRAASDVSLLGATPGKQWPVLSLAIMKARAALQTTGEI